MGYTIGQISNILLKADRTMYKIGQIAYDDMFAEDSEDLDYERDIIFIYKKAVEYADDFYVGTAKLDATVERLASKISIYDYGLLNPVYSDVASNISNLVIGAASLNDLTDVTISNLLDNQIIRYDASTGQWINVGPGSAVRNSQTFIATNGQTIFNTAYPFDIGLFDVYLNGVRLNSESFTTLGDYQIILTDAAVVDDIIDVVIYDTDTSIINLINSLSDLDDVLIGPLSNKQALYFNSTSGKWENGAVFVPYTGAISNVNLGTFDLTADIITGNTIVKVGGLSTQYLMADGSTSVLTNPITGTGISGQVAYWSGASTITGENGFTWDNTNKRLQFGTGATRGYITYDGSDNTIFNIDVDSGRSFRVGSSVRNIQVSAASNIFRSPLNIFQAANGAELARINSAGNFLLGSTTDNGLRFQVTGDGYFSGSVGIGTNVSLASYNLRVAKAMSGSSVVGIGSEGIVDGLAIAYYFNTSASTANTTFTLGNLYHYAAIQGTKGAASTITAQYGFFVDSTLIGGFSNYGFYGNIASGTGRWNLYMNGTAANYLAGNTGIRNTTPLRGLEVGSDGTNWISGTFVGSGGPEKVVIGNLSALATIGAHNAALSGWTNLQVSGAQLIFSISGSERMRLDASGRLGIGTNAPTERLVVRSIGNSYASSAAISIENNTGANKTYLTNANGVFYLTNSTSVDQVALYTTGNLSLSGTSDTGQRLQVTGDTLLKGSGATSATSALTVQNSDGTVIMSVRNDGWITGNLNPTFIRFATLTSNCEIFAQNGSGTFISTGSSAGQFFRSSLTSSGTDFFFGNGQGPNNQTSGQQTFINVSRNFTPTSGTATYQLLTLVSIINQTGGANGITRGLYVNPTLTAAADWRSIEWSNNTGFGLYGSGTCVNYLNGSLGIGVTNPALKLDVVGAIGARGSNYVASWDAGTGDGMFMQYFGTYGDLKTSANKYLSFTIGTTERMRLDASGNLGLGTASPLVVAGYTTFAVNNATNGANIDLMTAGTRHASWNNTATETYFGTRSNTPLIITTNATEVAKFYANGNFRVGAASADAGFRLDVNGTMRVSGASTFQADMQLSKSTASLAEFIINDGFTSSSTTEARLRVQAASTQGYFIANGPLHSVYKIQGPGDVSIYKSGTDGNITILNDRSTGNILMAAGGSSTAHFTIASTGAATFSSSVQAAQFNLSALNTAPTTSSSTGTLGEIRIDSNHIYVCTATNTWKRVAIATF